MASLLSTRNSTLDIPIGFFSIIRNRVRFYKYSENLLPKGSSNINSDLAFIVLLSLLLSALIEEAKMLR